MDKFIFKDFYGINDLLDIMKILRSENGCPWDREQNHHTIRKNLLEETYEVLEAIDNNDSDLLCEELGDLLLQIVFHSRMEEECGNFDFDKVANDICQKLIIRHPHVFGDVNVSDSTEVLKNWDSIKQKTKNQESYSETLESVPKVFPALLRSYKLLQRSERAGINYPVASTAENLSLNVSKLNNSLDNSDEAKKNIGNILFNCAEISRKLGLDPEECLQKQNENYIDTFKKSEDLLRQKGTDFKSLSINELNAVWQEAEKVK